jgi:hypothetical protein
MDRLLKGKADAVDQYKAACYIQTLESRLYKIEQEKTQEKALDET